MSLYRLNQEQLKCIELLANYANRGVGLNDVQRAAEPLNKALSRPLSKEDLEKEIKAMEKAKKEEEKEAKKKEDREEVKEAK